MNRCKIKSILKIIQAFGVSVIVVILYGNYARIRQSLQMIKSLEESLSKFENVIERDVPNETTLSSINRQNESLKVVELPKENFAAREYSTKGRNFTLKKGNLEFIHITKTGGTTIENWAASAGKAWGSCRYRPYAKRLFCNQLISDKGKKNKRKNLVLNDWRKNELDWSVVPEAFHNITDLRLNPWHTPPHWFKENPFKNKDVFTVVRNPYTRAISEYYCEWFGYKGKGENNPTNLDKWIKRKIRTIPNNGHLLPQYYYVYNKYGYKVVDHVLRVENLNEEFQELMKSYSLNINLGKKTNARKDRSWLTVANLTRSTINKINSCYADDFKFFNYSLL